eukprot:CAMPEP_0177621882 /NCGR_PEP_ID=MMETSP0419_2-20121207/27877_1 /TAXON_ID=582737 /ORGANISM="Tetraselmis sp., Strain GSL018" /LENGTH=729 /DNA_ID=CAMNT_0019121939 /DNA_START=46 /DNA_END=2233 /DNA_ORIENTATION=-
MGDFQDETYESLTDFSPEVKTHRARLNRYVRDLGGPKWTMAYGMLVLLSVCAIFFLFSYRSQLAATEETRRLISEELKSAKAETQSLLALSAKCNTEKEETTETLRQTNSSLRQCLSRATGLEQQLQEAEGDARRKAKDIAELKSSFREEINTKSHYAESLQGELDSLRGELQVAKDELSQAKASLQRTQDELRESQSAKAEAEGAKDKCAADLIRSEDDVAKANQRLSASVAEKDACSKEAASRDEQVKDLEARANRYKTEAEDLRSRLERITAAGQHKEAEPSMQAERQHSGNKTRPAGGGKLEESEADPDSTNSVTAVEPKRAESKGSAGDMIEAGADSTDDQAAMAALEGTQWNPGCQGNQSWVDLPLCDSETGDRQDFEKSKARALWPSCGSHCLYSATRPVSMAYFYNTEDGCYLQVNASHSCISNSADHDSYMTWIGGVLASRGVQLPNGTGDGGDGKAGTEPDVPGHGGQEPQEELEKDNSGDDKEGLNEEDAGSGGEQSGAGSAGNAAPGAAAVEAGSVGKDGNGADENEDEEGGENGVGDAEEPAEEPKGHVKNGVDNGNDEPGAHMQKKDGNDNDGAGNDEAEEEEAGPVEENAEGVEGHISNEEKEAEGSGALSRNSRPGEDDADEANQGNNEENQGGEDANRAMAQLEGAWHKGNDSMVPVQARGGLPQHVPCLAIKGAVSMGAAEHTALDGHSGFENLTKLLAFGLLEILDDEPA